MGWPAPRSAAVLPVAILVVGTLELLLLRPSGWPIGIAGETLACVALIWRRAVPMAAPLAAIAAMVGMYAVGPALDEPSVPIVILGLISFSLARWNADLRGLFGLLALAVGVAGLYLTVDTRSHDWSDVVYISALLGPPFVLGRITRRLHDQREELSRQAEQLRSQQVLIKDQAVREERDRIARELHDVIAHSISAMVVQASAAQDLLRTDPSRASAALDAVTSTGRQALTNTGSLLHTIRDSDDEQGLAPAPRLAGLDELINDFQASGLQVELDTNGPLDGFSPSVELSIFRIVEETLTNALRYAPDRRTTLSLTSTPTRFTVHAENAVPLAEPVAMDGAERRGLGLLGMAERAALLGGTLRHGRQDGRFTVTVDLPIAEAPAP